MAREEEEYEKKDMKGRPDGSFENFLKPLTYPFFPFLLRSEKLFLTHTVLMKVEGGGSFPLPLLLSLKLQSPNSLPTAGRQAPNNIQLPMTQ